MAKEPAKSRKPRKTSTPKKTDADVKVTQDEAITDAEVVTDTPAEPPEMPEPDQAPKAAEEVTPEPVPEPDPVPEADEKTAEPPATAPEPTPEPRQSIVLPLVLGGAFAGLIGYGISYMQHANQAPDVPAVTQADIDGLRSDIAALPAPPDTSDLAAAIAGLQETTSRIDSEIAALEERISTVERQPSGDGTLPQTAIDAFEADMQALRDQVAAQQEELASVADQTAARLETTRAEALAIEQNAVEAARAATAKASLARVQGALESGAPFGGILGELEAALGEPAPAALSAVADGTATLGSLQSEFPSAARQALADARSEGVDGEESGGFSAFLRDQLDVRSVAPKEGNSVDATLSRAEAALREGRLNEALSEIGTLPEIARAAMSDWLTQAEARAAAIDAADTLSNTLSAN